MNLRKLLEAARATLSHQPEARLEAEILLAHVLESPRSFLYANPELELSRKRQEQFRRLVSRRAQGEPIAYLTGTREFWSLTLQVSPDVLIPRPETELLVEAALQLIPKPAQWRIADLGTGSGAIALAMASERPGCEIHATDISHTALELAAANAQQLKQFSLRFHLSFWGDALEGPFDVIISNPPYIAEDDPHLGEGDLRFEPRQALTPGTDGMSAIRIIAAQSMKLLRRGGWLLFEHGLNQGEASREVLAAAGYTDIDTCHDLAGHERVTIGQKPLTV